MILPTLPPLTPTAKQRLIAITDTYAKGHKENILHYLETGEVKIEELPLLDRVPEIKDWLIHEYNAWRFPADSVEQAARSALEAMLPPRPEDIESWTSDKVSALEASLQTYITAYEDALPNGNIVSKAKNYLQAIKNIREREIEKQEWEQVDILSYSALFEYYRRHPKTPFFKELDDNLWVLVKGEPLDITLVRRFLREMPLSSHQGEATAIDREYADWEFIKSERRLEDVFRYLNNHPTGFFRDEARALLEELKNEKLKAIKAHLGQYTLYDYREWTAPGGIFTDADFIAAGIVTRESLKALEVPETERDLNLSKTNYDCPAGCTDVYFLGIPNTGKTCILMGLLNTDGKHLDWDHFRFGGDYGCELQKLCDKWVTPMSTLGDFATLFTGAITDYEDESIIHPVNLIEMAGEAFALKIAQNKDAKVTISDLGDGIPQMLSNPNDKIFFIVIDPTSDDAKCKKRMEVDGKTELVEIAVPQKATLTKFCDLLSAKENKEIMRKVRGLYIITAKADRLGTPEEREAKSVKIVTGRYSQSVEKLKKLCHPNIYDLNALTNNEIRVFPFSLGNFYLGNSFKYDPADSERIIRIISRLASGKKRGHTWWDRTREWFNER